MFSKGFFLRVVKSGLCGKGLTSLEFKAFKVTVRKSFFLRDIKSCHSTVQSYRSTLHQAIGSVESDLDLLSSHQPRILASMLKG